MDIQQVQSFFMWCSIINGSLLLFWTMMILMAPDLVYRTQYRFLPLTRDSFNNAMYLFIGLFKIFFLVFNLAPYLALLLIS